MSLRGFADLLVGWVDWVALLLGAWLWSYA